MGHVCLFKDIGAVCQHSEYNGLVVPEQVIHALIFFVVINDAFQATHNFTDSLPIWEIRGIAWYHVYIHTFWISWSVSLPIKRIYIHVKTTCYSFLYSLDVIRISHPRHDENQFLHAAILLSSKTATGAAMRFLSYTNNLNLPPPVSSFAVSRCLIATNLIASSIPSTILSMVQFSW